MFDITSDDINQLNDTDLRELVGRLCEAELTSRGLSPHAVTWGGSQTAADGGLDVRVSLPADTSISGFVPRPATGFQVKKPDMPRSEIIEEMRPSNVIRPVIEHLAAAGGAYIIISSAGSTADKPLLNRQSAMREAINGVHQADELYTDFYDRTRLATWVRCHPGLITWVKERVGKSLSGWRPYGPWGGANESVDAEYFLDDQLRLHLGQHRDTPAQSVANAIDDLRKELARPGKLVRLVGLSGVGKTRFAQVLFDTRIGLHPLPPSLAVYTNLSDNPDPQPIGMATDLIASRTRAVLIVDNCPPDLHRRLSEVCGGSESTVSVLTIEYDVRDDQPEGTQVVTLDTSSPALIEKLVRHRYVYISEVDARTIAAASGGNARIAIALAETVERSDTIAGLSNDELFQRLFRQRQDPNEALLRAAQACSLVYSFQGEALTEDEAELPRLAALAEQTPVELYRHVAELFRRNLVQHRGDWRAVLPHAIANQLAARALDETLYDHINQQLIAGGTQRLARSFSRRLSFLHDHPRAVAIVEGWLAPDGLLGNVAALNEDTWAMFENVSPVLPETALAALERANNGLFDAFPFAPHKPLRLLRSLAYDSSLFERSAQLLALATKSEKKRQAKEAVETFVSLFTLYLSGTHASIAQRHQVIEQLLKSREKNSQELGLAAFGAMLKTIHFSSRHQFEFGARSRDFGYQPNGPDNIREWYGATLQLLERLALSEGLCKPELSRLLAQNFRGLWTRAHMQDDLERLFELFAMEGFWREGWVACRETIYFGKNLEPADAVRLNALAVKLSPTNLEAQIKAVVLGDRSNRFELEDVDIDGDVAAAYERLELHAKDLGSSVTADEDVFAALLPHLLQGGSRAHAFGQGLAAASPDPARTWAQLIGGLEQIAIEKQDVQVLRGFLFQIGKQDKTLCQQILDSALDNTHLARVLPLLYSAVELDEHGVEQLKAALNSGQTSVQMYQNLAFGRTTANIAGGTLKGLLMRIADQPGGIDIALEILQMRFYGDRSTSSAFDHELLEGGRELLQRIEFGRDNDHFDYCSADVAKSCLIGPDAAPTATQIAARLRAAVAVGTTWPYHNGELLNALFATQPTATLDGLFSGTTQDQDEGVRLIEQLDHHRGNPTTMISCAELIDWCEKDSGRRYQLAASIISFAHHPKENSPLNWTEQALAVLLNAPNFESVLTIFVERFPPRSWSGSRAALIEANAQLLPLLEQHVPSLHMPFVEDYKARLAKEITAERQWETKHDRIRDERFE